MKKQTNNQKKEYLAQIYRRNWIPFALSVAAALLISAVNLIIARSCSRSSTPSPAQALIRWGR